MNQPGIEYDITPEHLPHPEIGDMSTYLPKIVMWGGHAKIISS